MNTILPTSSGNTKESHGSPSSPSCRPRGLAASAFLRGLRPPLPDAGAGGGSGGRASNDASGPPLPEPGMQSTAPTTAGWGGNQIRSDKHRPHRWPAAVQMPNVCGAATEHIATKPNRKLLRGRLTTIGITGHPGKQLKDPTPTLPRSLWLKMHKPLSHTAVGDQPVLAPLSRKAAAHCATKPERQ